MSPPHNAEVLHRFKNLVIFFPNLAIIIYENPWTVLKGRCIKTKPRKNVIILHLWAERQKKMELKGSKTEQNLITAFAGESQARNKYTMFADVAKKEGFEQIAGIFQATADNEYAHAKIWLKELSGILGVKENLAIAAAGENSEWTEMYPEFAKIAKEEGFDCIARLFEYVGAIEKEHEERFKRTLKNVEQSKVFTKDGSVIWICRNCGFIHEGASAPEMCPVCAHSKAYFEVFRQLP